MNELRMMAVKVNTSGTFGHGRPQELFNMASPTYVVSPYDVTADGQRFIFAFDEDPGAGHRYLNLVQDWFEDLRRRAPAR